ncbi:hypothetical protein [Bartonella rochalimae]|uniref:hypothetical protein n=1 Tax=Bartonella rochalimae TaxID=395923 RepID=UPI0005571B60|nr:hypothetical protein [Bartonella rochalimae]
MIGKRNTPLALAICHSAQHTHSSDPSTGKRRIGKRNTPLALAICHSSQHTSPSNRLKASA